MYLRNLLKSGDYVSFVPIGIPVTLQYNEKGELQKIYKGYEIETREDISKKVLKSVRDNSIVPGAISIQQGTSWIYGIFYTDDIQKVSGDEDTYIDACIEYLINNANTFKFYAASAKSEAMAFRGAMATRRWLSYSAFELVPGAIVPTGIDAKSFNDLFNSSNYNFSIPSLSYYIIYRGEEIIYEPTKFTSIVVTSIKESIDDEGYILSTIHDSKISFKIVTNFNNVYKHQLHKNDFAIIDRYGSISYVEHYSDTQYPKERICKFCGNAIINNSNILTRCNNIACASRLFPRIVHMQKVLRIPEITRPVFDELIKSNSLICLTDIFSIDGFNSKISTSLNTLLRSFVLPEQCSDIAIQRLVNYANNNLDNLNYYIRHSDKLDSDVSTSEIIELLNWLNIDEINLEWQTLLGLPNIILSEVDRKFDGAPIFRNMKIAITGDFVHGSVSEVSSILRSYAATVVDTFSNDVNCVVTGSLYENINGSIIKKAKELGIPVIDECDFFRKFEIDSDMRFAEVM